jgi:predicted amidophosphoribosyltransferase
VRAYRLCPRCGPPAWAEDAFCGRCGAPATVAPEGPHIEPIGEAPAQSTFATNLALTEPTRGFVAGATG